MPEYSGIAGVVPRAEPIPNQGFDQLAGFAEKLLAIKSAQKQQAATQLESTVRMATQFGFMVDPKKIAQLVKKSGLPISMKDEDLAAGVVASKVAQSGSGQQQPGGGQQVGASPGSGGAGPQGQQQQQPKPTMSKDEKMGMWINNLAGQARRMMNLKASTEEQKAKFEADVTSLKSKVMDGGPEGDKAAGKLIQLGELKFDMSAATWNNASPEQREKIVNIAAGAETDAQRNARGDQISASLMPYFDNKADAMNAGHIMASGGALPSDLQARMKKYSFNDLAEQAKMSETLMNMGLPSSQLHNLSQVAAVTGLQNALPSGMKTVAMQELELEQGRMKVETARYQKEVEIAQRATIAEMSKALSAEKRADLDTFKSLVEMKKAGGAIPEDLLKGAMIKAGDALNMDVQEVDTLFHFLTGGTKLEFSPRLSPGGEATVDRFAGTPKKRKEPGIIQQITGAMKPKEPI